MTYNVGGMTMTVYDTLRCWLQNNQEVDVLLLQEIHWSLGREETSWAIPGWLFIISPDPGARHSGVGVVISRRIASAHTLSFCTWLPGRILQVRCEAKQANLDIICAYQWVRKDNAARDPEQLRGKFWSVLGGLLKSLPRRNMLVLGGDFNSTVASLPGLIGRGLLPHPTRKPEPEFLTVLGEHKLCLLNTWSRAKPAVCATFRNGAVVSQIDFVAVRRRNADALARRAKPTSLDLAPGREGPKHRAVAATIPIVPGWRLPKGLVPHKPQYSKEELARELQYPTARTEAFRSQARAAVVREMWRRHRALKTRQAGSASRQIFSAWLRYRDFMRAWRALRAISRNARKRWLEDQVAQAEVAAAKHDMPTVYRVIQRIAPKRRYESVRVRGADGRLLNKVQQFQALLEYFRAAFSSMRPLKYTSSCADPQFTQPEIVVAIQQLKNMKAVPTASPTAEVWKHCPQELAEYFQVTFQHSRQTGPKLPQPMTDCTLSLLPKPQKPLRRPQDLRPLGLQDPSSKVLAGLVRNRLQEQVRGWLADKPQFAYIAGRSGDEAISRVFHRCQSARESLKAGVDSVHAKRAGARSVPCSGGALLSIDLSRAFDTVPRQALSQALQAAGVEPALHDLVLDLHEHCQHEISQNGFTDKFDMQCGVRQGCSLSPLLYAIFTGWIYDVIKDRTDANWARDFITMYADDTVLQWQVRSVQDLHFMCRCVQHTFRALREVGMSVNSSKSKIVIKLQGPQAKAWLRKHLFRTPQGPVLRLGTPCNPIDIPRVHSLTYLGVEASLSSFEMQTCALRLRMSAQIKHRLIKVLHAAKLGLHHRVRLYQACLRSSMLYGQHAVGITTAVLRRLEAADACHLRGIARSPAHLTHESSVHLRQRLRILSPQQALQQLLQRRAANSMDEPSRARFKALLAWLRVLEISRPWMCMTPACDCSRLTPIDT